MLCRHVPAVVHLDAARHPARHEAGVQRRTQRHRRLCMQACARVCVWGGGRGWGVKACGVCVCVCLEVCPWWCVSGGVGVSEWRRVVLVCAEQCAMGNGHGPTSGSTPDRMGRPDTCVCWGTAAQGDGADTVRERGGDEGAAPYVRVRIPTRKRIPRSPIS